MSAAGIAASERARAKRRAAEMVFRKLDARIEQEVFGHEVRWRDVPNVRRSLWVREYNNHDGGGRAYHGIVPSYSKSHEDAFHLVAKMLAGGCGFTLEKGDSHWSCDFGTWVVYGATAPLAICGAALRHLQECPPAAGGAS